MCGFAGTVSSTPLFAADLCRLRAATDALRHRGPDDEGYVLLGNERAHELRGADTIAELVHLPHIQSAQVAGATVALASRRLAIIDLSASGHMPMRDKRSGSWIVYNGELYNYQELRDELEARGHVFHSLSDTEVLLHAYAEWGSECLERFNGMWAFAIWDAQQRKLFAARDRFGEKQFYFAQTPGGQLWFGSEIRPLRLAGASHDGVDDELIWDFLMYGLADHTERTFFRGIRQLLPGEMLEFRPGGAPAVREYYRLQDRICEAREHCDISESAAGLRERLYESVQIRLRSDVPVASFLSAGLDSSSIVAMANRAMSAPERAHSQNLRTYTNCYPEGHPFDESPRVHQAVRQWQRTDPVFVQGSVENFERDLLAMVACQEQPFHNVSIFASFNLLRLIRQQDAIKVVLTGEAGDEILAGYYRVYLPVYLSSLLARGSLARWGAEGRHWGWRRSLKASAKGLIRKMPARGRHALQRFRNPAVDVMNSDFLRRHMARDEEWNRHWRAKPLNERLIADITRFNLPQLLRHLDRNAMHFSVETRVPFLDHRLVEYACSLPEEFKLRQGYSKYALRRAVDGVLPDDIVWNRSKLGFGMAEQFWFGTFAERLADCDALRPYVDPARLAERVRTRKGSVQQMYWLPVSLGLWLQQIAAGN